jgi:hypothetical protein
LGEIVIASVDARDEKAALQSPGILFASSNEGVELIQGEVSCPFRGDPAHSGDQRQHIVPKTTGKALIH